LLENRTVESSENQTSEGTGPLVDDPFEITMRGLMAGLRVRDIATFPFMACEASEVADVVLSCDELSVFDFIPVKQNSRIVGVLERGETQNGRSAGERMRPLDDSILVSADEPLPTVVAQIAKLRYRLVVGQSGIAGIVTRSDLHKLPVRLLAFAYVTHLETTMADRIQAAFPRDKSWIDFLDEPRRDNISKKRSLLRRDRDDPPLLELTDFCDKREITQIRSWRSRSTRRRGVVMKARGSVYVRS
jgi:hypothetical protein